MEQALCFWPDPADPAWAAARRAMLPMKVRIRAVSQEQTGQTLGFLLGRGDFPPVQGGAPTVSDPILVLDGFSGARLNALLSALSRAKVPRSVFKAVVTADNIGWTLAQLWEELSRERQAIESGQAPEHGA